MNIRFLNEPGPDLAPRASASRQSGIALVITLIMLSVTLIMAVAFLAVSTRERGSVTTSTDSTHARLAADSALANAEGQILASILSTTNPYNFGLLVSTNYLNAHGFAPNSASPTNVNYTYRTDGNPLGFADFVQNVANLQILPRAPVFIVTNSSAGSGYDFRYYLDLNRNGQFDDTGPVTNWQWVGSSLVTNGMVSQIGDPQWIGVLEHPDAPHGPLNRFIARYCFIAVPVGNTLDVNAIYNDATAPLLDIMKPTTDGFLRNEGVGSWELNLAAFLADLNTNEWDHNLTGNGYNYNEPGAKNEGAPFDDALSILRYRYNYYINSQAPVTQFANWNTLGFNSAFDNIDEFSLGPLMTNSLLPYSGYDKTTPWAGSDNTNQFFTLSDFFSTTIFRPSVYSIPLTTFVFPDRLIHAGTNTYPTTEGNQVPTYDRYTFYRMLSQLGSDSTPESGKMNLNFVNVGGDGNVVPGAETNFIPWTNSLAFFTNAADRLLRAYTSNWFQANPQWFLSTYYGNPGNYYHGTVTNDPSGMGLTNRPLFGMTNQIPAFGITAIPVFMNGLTFTYSPAIQRLLQLAANIYDATTTNIYPSVFRPTFYLDSVSSNVFINGYQPITNDVDGLSDYRLLTPVDITALALGNIPTVGSGLTRGMNNVNVYGIPWIIGAKKGFPSFNELYMFNNAQVTRKMEVVSPAGNGLSVNSTNKQYLVGITNLVGMSMWNSYSNNYYGTRNITVYMGSTMNMALTNGAHSSGNLYSPATIYFFTTNLTYWPGSAWPGVQSVAVDPNSFLSVVFTNIFLPTSAYVSANGSFINILNDPPWETNVLYYQFPPMGITTTNRAQAYILDGPAGAQHVIDYVQFGGPNVSQNLTNELADPPNSGIWSINPAGPAKAGGTESYGEFEQILMSMGEAGTRPPTSEAWTDPTGGQQTTLFRAFVQGQSSYTYQGHTYPIIGNSQQAPYTPQRTMANYTLWQANDPLVHYLAADLNYISTTNVGVIIADNGLAFPTLPGLNLNQVGQRYQPWGLSVQMVNAPGADVNANNIAYRDSYVWGSDYWQFPTNLFPNVGWLGRVHRGTPWQTVFLKSTNLFMLPVTAESHPAYGSATWQDWTGNNGNPFDATNTAPVQDRLLFDLFTTAPNDNATKGQLSVNQPHLAAWSAVFSGLPIYTNLAGTNLFAQPAGLFGTNYGPGTNAMGAIWTSISQTRANTNLFPQQVFTHLGDILATPALTDGSPFLQGLNGVGVNDEMYEWLPLHVLSQLTLGTPRYVIYCYGQALKPAPNGIMAGGTYPLMCTNYQIVAETATRAVVQVENANTTSPKLVLKNLNPLPPDQ